MLLAIRRHQEKDYQSITDSLGTDSWRKQMPKYRGKTHILFLDVFRQQLSKLGYYTTYYNIKSKVNSPQYFLIFATYNDAIFKIHKAIEPHIKKLQEKEWVKKIAELNYLIQKVHPTQNTLDFW